MSTPSSSPSSSYRENFCQSWSLPADLLPLFIVHLQEVPDDVITITIVAIITIVAVITIITIIIIWSLILACRIPPASYRPSSREERWAEAERGQHQTSASSPSSSISAFLALKASFCCGGDRLSVGLTLSVKTWFQRVMPILLGAFLGYVNVIYVFCVLHAIFSTSIISLYLSVCL